MKGEQVSQQKASHCVFLDPQPLHILSYQVLVEMLQSKFVFQIFSDFMSTIHEFEVYFSKSYVCQLLLCVFFFCFVF